MRKFSPIWTHAALPGTNLSMGEVGEIMTRIELAHPQTAPQLKKPVRMYCARTVDEALTLAATHYTQRGWSMPDECYTITKRNRVEVYLPVGEVTA